MGNPHFCLHLLKLICMLFLDILANFFPTDKEVHDFFDEHAQSINVKKSEIISQQDSHNKNVYFLEKGFVRTYYYENGRDITNNFYLEGRVFANVDTLFNKEPTKFNIEAIEDSEILYCNYERLEELCKKSLSAANFRGFILGKLLVQMMERVSTLQFMTAKERYAALIKDNPEIILRAPLGMVASYLGISQETLSRIRSTI